MNYYKVQWLRASLRVSLAQLHPAVSSGWGIVVIGTPQIKTNDSRDPSHSSHTLCAYTPTDSETDGEQKSIACELYSARTSMQICLVKKWCKEA